jgi:hypothetical protein
MHEYLFISLSVNFDCAGDEQQQQQQLVADGEQPLTDDVTAPQPEPDDAPAEGFAPEEDAPDAETVEDADD